MPPPTNTTPATATEILVSALPYITSQEVSNGIDAQTVYFKLTNDLDHDIVIMYWFHGEIPPGGFSYAADYDVWAEVGLVNRIIGGVTNCELQLPIQTGASYWIKVFSAGASPLTTATLQINISAKPYSTSYPAGQILIFAASTIDYHVDYGGAFAGFIEPSTGTIVNFIPLFPVCEYGDQLRSNGIFLISDNHSVTGTPPGTPPSFGAWYVLRYDKNFTLLNQLVMTGGNGFEPIIRANQTTNKFWVVAPGYGDPNSYANVNSSGVISSVTNMTALPDGVGLISVTAISATNNESHLLVAPDSSSGNNYIYKWNLSTLAWDGSIGSPVSSYRPVDMLITGDDTVLILYQHSNDRDVKLLHYNFSGTLLLDYGIVETKTSSFFPRLGHAIDPLYFWMWSPYNDGSTSIRKIKISDGTFAINSETRNVYDTTIEQANPALICVSDSCPIIEMMVSGGSEEPEPEPGLHTVVTNKRFDGISSTVSEAIPNPTWKTALIP